jgi:hypothetical protein
MGTWHNRRDLKTTRLGLLATPIAPRSVAPASALLWAPLLALAAAGWGCSSPVAATRPIDGGADHPVDAPRDVAIEVYCAADAMGGGLCPINFCGQLLSTAALPPNAYAQSGADILCNGGRICVVGPALAAGDGFQLSCELPATASPLPFGTACSSDPSQDLRCANDSLCIASTDFPSQPFCSALCRNDADCPGSARCLEYPTANLPNGTHAEVGMCTPLSKIAGTPCARESDCSANQGCVSDGARTTLTVCKPTTGTKSVGQPCTGAADCRSGTCYDRNFELSGGQNRTYCSAVCAVNSDCGSDQTCARLVLDNNGTSSDPTDDVVVGACQTLFVPIGATGCGIDSDCTALQNGSDTCDATHGLCYRKAALPGSACTADTGCQLGGVCSMGTRFPGGYCQTYGCDPKATTGVDACAGAASVCTSRGGPDAPLNACYEGCSFPPADAAVQDTCSRATGGYDCEPSGVSTNPQTLCLSRSTT